MANTTIIQQNNINFTVDTRINRYTGWDKRYSNANNIGATSYPADPANIAFGINSVEIDWNGAELELPDALGGTKTINTTGQFFRRL